MAGRSRSDDEIADVGEEEPHARRRKPAKAAKAPKRAATGRRAQVLRVLRWVAIGGLGAGVLGLLSVTGLFLYYGSDPKLPNLKRLSD
jgi:anti-sigma factor RsiW